MAQGLISNPLLPTYAPGRRDMSVHSDGLLAADPVRYDSRFSGNFKIVGTVAVAGTPDVPVARLVVLFDVKLKIPVRSTVSSPGGVYEFNFLSRGPWFVVSYDYTGEYNAVIADNILGEPM